MTKLSGILRSGLFAAIGAFVIGGTGWAAADNQDRAQSCNQRSLRGRYGILVTGTAPAGPAQTERFVGTAIRTYDGRGNFVHIDTTHGELTGVVMDREGSGTYEVNSNCTGRATMFIAGLPFPVESAFVIVDQGQEVKEAVLSPAASLVTAVQRRVF